MNTFGNSEVITCFLKFELQNKSMLSDLINLSMNENLISFEYECNMYNVLFDRKNEQVIIKDCVSEENGVSNENTHYKW